MSKGRAEIEQTVTFTPNKAREGGYMLWYEGHLLGYVKQMVSGQWFATTDWTDTTTTSATRLDAAVKLVRILDEEGTPHDRAALALR